MSESFYFKERFVSYTIAAARRPLNDEKKKKFNKWASHFIGGGCTYIGEDPSK